MLNTKIVLGLFLGVIMLSLKANVAMAKTVESGASASLKINQDSPFSEYRVLILREFLGRYNSPLTPYAPEFVAAADEYGIDYRLVPAITGVESTFGKRIPSKSYNAYGWANGEYKFSSWENSIDHVSMTLRTKYIDKGAPTIAKIARRYAPPSSTWAGKVKFFVGKIDSLPVSFDI
ncbi:MAG: hypothetical protein AAB622_01535 [Patescibacteria group bacterium]